MRLWNQLGRKETDLEFKFYFCDRELYWLIIVFVCWFIDLLINIMFIIFIVFSIFNVFIINFLSNISLINPLMPGGNKKSHILKVCLNMCDLFVTTGH